MANAKVVSFLNFKGGVGKTSLVVNLGALLAREGQKVLIVDLDAQSNSSVWLMRLDRWNLLNRRQDAFVTQLFFSPEQETKDRILSDVIRNDNDEPLVPGLDLIPAHFPLMDLETEFQATGPESHLSIFYQKLSEIRGDYDWILIDCPPHFYKASQAAVFSSDHILVPANPDALSIIGLHLLATKLVTFRKATTEEREGLQAPSASIGGVLLNNIKTGSRYDIPREQMDNQLERFRPTGCVSPNASVWEETIRNSVTMGRSVMRGLPAFLLPSSENAKPVVSDLEKAMTKLMDLN